MSLRVNEPVVSMASSMRPGRAQKVSAKHQRVEEHEAGTVRATVHRDASAVALEMADDVSALLAALRQRRRNGGDGESADPAGVSWMDHLLEQGNGNRLDALRKILAKGEAGTESYSLVRQLFPDDSDCLVACRLLGREEDLDDTERSLLDELLSLLEADLDVAGVKGWRGASAGIHAAPKARLIALSTGLNASSLRDSYRAFLDLELGPLSQYELWIEQYGFKARKTVLDFVERCLVADIYSLSPSCSAIEFGNVLRHVHRLSSVRSADVQLLSRGWHATLMLRLRVDKGAWLASMFAIIRNPDHLGAIFDGALEGARLLLDPDEKALLLQSMRRGLAAMSPALWASEDAYMATFAAIDEIAHRASAVEFRHYPKRSRCMA